MELTEQPAFKDLLALVKRYRVCVLTGAGVSTRSGIPDYRSPEQLQRKRKPIEYQPFITQAAMRERYWSRSMNGWPHFSSTQPNDAHRALAQLEKAGEIQGIITQNVDRLHHKAGSQRVVELHGALSEACCLSCGTLEARDALQTRLTVLNPNWLNQPTMLAPDGDADLPESPTEPFILPTCLECEGMLKPNVVLFGESVDKGVLQKAWDVFDESDMLLVVGSSLTVYSGFRFARKAAQRGMPIAIINIGATRADDLTTLHLETEAGETLQALSKSL